MTMSCSVNEQLADFASTLRARAETLDREAAANDAQTLYVTAYGGDGGGDLSRPYKAQAEAQRREAQWLRTRAEYADRGQFLIDGTRIPDPRESHIQAVAARASRLVPYDPRTAAVAADLPGTGAHAAVTL
jgi:hypothetical protein